MMTQKQAVISEVLSILGTSYDSNISVKGLLTKTNLKAIKTNIINGIVAENIAYSKDIKDTLALDSYVRGMISNHFRRAKELNGNKATAKSTPTKTLDDLKVLLNECDKDSDIYKDINEEINKIKAKNSEISGYSDLPDELKELADTLS